MKKKIVALVICMVMIATVFPITVFASSGKNGFYKDNGSWYYFRNNKIQTTMTGLASGTIDNKKGVYFLNKGKFSKSTGIAQYVSGTDKNWYYVENGVYTKKTTITKRAESSKKTEYYVKNGKLNEVTGNVKVNGKTYFLYKGICQNNGWKTAYGKILDKVNLYSWPWSSTPEKVILLKDIGGNKIPELFFIRMENNSYATRFLDIYTYINGKAVKVKSFSIGGMAAGYSTSLNLMKNGRIYFREQYGDDHIRQIIYSYYSFANGKTLKKTKKVNITFEINQKNPKDRYYPMKMFANGKYIKKVNSYSSSISAADKKAGYAGNAKAALIPGTFTENSMTKAEAMAYLSK